MDDKKQSRPKKRLTDSLSTPANRSKLTQNRAHSFTPSRDVVPFPGAMQAVKPTPNKASMGKQVAHQLSLHTQLPIGSKQRSKLKSRLYPRTTHGGDPAKGKRKTERPFTTSAPLHIVLKSHRAKGSWSMLHRKHRSKITSMIYVYAQRFKIEVYRASNVGNHLHLLVRAKERKNLADYLRVLAGRVAVTVTGAQKAVKRVGKFWDSLCWSRLVNWGRDFFQVREYLVNNLTDQAMQLATTVGTAADLAALDNLWGEDTA